MRPWFRHFQEKEAPRQTIFSLPFEYGGQLSVYHGGGVRTQITKAFPQFVSVRTIQDNNRKAEPLKTKKNSG